MGVSSVARLPTLGAQSIPALFNHLQISSNARVVSRWSVTIRSFRAIPVPIDVYPEEGDQGTAPSSDKTHGAGNSNETASGSGPTPLTKPRTMWQVWLSEYPGVVFIIIEDSGKMSRAKVWKDWEVRKKKWREAKREEKKMREEKEEKKKEEEGEDSKEEIKDPQLTRAESTQPPSQSATQIETQTSAAESLQQNTTVTPIATTTKEDTESDAMDVDKESITSATNETVSPTDTTLQSQADLSADPQEKPPPPRAGGAKPVLHTPCHTRYTLSAMTTSLSTMLSNLNLPPPHGAPVGTAGPGAWVPRGVAVSIEGLILEIGNRSSSGLGAIGSLPSYSAGANAEEASLGNTDWRVRVGSVVGVGGRSAGAVVEAEFLPISNLLPTSPFVQDFLQSLFPPHLVGSVNPIGQSAAMIATTAPSMQVGLNGGSPSSFDAATGFSRSDSSFPSASIGIVPSPSYNQPFPTPFGSRPFTSHNSVATSSSVSKQPSSLHIPHISDQLWEEVVPRSTDEWSRMIETRCRKQRLRRRRRQRQNPSETIDKPKLPSPSVSPFEWQPMDSDDSDNHLESLSTDSSSDWDTDDPTASGIRMDGTTVKMQGVNDDDDDEDLPLGALIAAPPPPKPVEEIPSPIKKEDNVKLTFEGLRFDLADSQGNGWKGMERGRRIAFTYVQMLRSEGII